MRGTVDLSLWGISCGTDLIGEHCWAILGEHDLQVADVLWHESPSLGAFYGSVIGSIWLARLLPWRGLSGMRSRGLSTCYYARAPTCRALLDTYPTAAMRADMSLSLEGLWHWQLLAQKILARRLLSWDPTFLLPSKWADRFCVIEGGSKDC